MARVGRPGQSIGGGRGKCIDVAGVFPPEARKGIVENINPIEPKMEIALIHCHHAQCQGRSRS